MNHWSRLGALALSAVLATSVVGAQENSGNSDAQVEASILKAMASDARLANQPIQSSTAFGVVTLTGTVPDEATRDEAEKIASHTPGVKKVVDQLAVGIGAGAPAGAPAAAGEEEDPAARNLLPGDQPVQDGAAGPVNGNQAPDATQTGQYPVQPQSQQSGRYPQGSVPPNYPQQQGGGYGQGYPGGDQGNVGYGNPNAAQPATRIYRRDWERQQQQSSGYPGPAAQNGYAPQGGQPGGQRVTLAGGTVIPARITRWLSSGDAQPGTAFSAVVEQDVLAGGYIAVPRGAELRGTVIDAKGAGALKGRGSLTLAINTLVLGAQQIPVQSEPFTVNGHDKTVRSVNTTLGVAALGAIIGGAAGGGAGAGIGAGVGAVAGLGASAASGGGNARIPAEALLHFQLTSPVGVATLSEAEMQRLGNYAGPQGARRPLPPPGYGPYAYGPYYYGPYGYRRYYGYPPPY